MVVVFLINHVLDGSKLLHMTRDGDCTLLFKTIFFFSLLQQLHEEWMIEIDNRNHKSLLFFTLSYFYSQTALWHISYLWLLPMLMIIEKMRQVQMLATHIDSQNSQKVKRNKIEKETINSEFSQETIKSFPKKISRENGEGFQLKWDLVMVEKP